MGKWKEIKLEEIAQLSKKGWKVGDENLPYIGLEHIEENKLRLNGRGHSEGVASNKFRFEAGDTLFGKLRPYFRKVIKPDFDGICSTDIWVVKPKNGVDESFLFYFFANKEFVDLAYASSGGTRMPRADWNFMKETKWPVPPLPTQRATASVLSSLDDKIDLLHRQNTTLEALAETLFREWFVEETGEDWEYEELGNVVDTTSGGTPSRRKKEFFEDGVYPWIKSKELDGTFILSTEEKITEEALKKSSAKVLPERSIIIAMYGATVGEYAITTGNMTCNQAICALTPNAKFPYTFLFMYINKMSVELKNMAVGSAQQNISQKLIKTLLIPLAYDRIEAFHEIMEPSFKRIQINLKQIQMLEKLRNTLLPKLMSGDLKIKED